MNRPQMKDDNLNHIFKYRKQLAGAIVGKSIRSAALRQAGSKAQPETRGRKACTKANGVVNRDPVSKRNDVRLNVLVVDPRPHRLLGQIEQTGEDEQEDDDLEAE
ncbi:MAG: hypothetical protein MnENMB40S_10770 [Rhizobiaceae bacterium MnEN-MB40S]|nr:MAG: hypothetical protein MnENMB40S_10770 [Rhizobiaceae bacterium MnEN-MB40S]